MLELKGSARHRRRSVAALLCLALLVSGPAAAADPAPAAPRAGESPRGLPPESTASPWQRRALEVVDVFPIRILSASATVVGFAAFLVSVPLVAPGGQMRALRESWDYFVMGPVNYTFLRPLGEL